MLYYGSATTFTRPMFHVAALARHVKINYAHLQSILTSFIKQGKCIETFTDKRLANRALDQLTPELREYLLDRKRLTEWTGKSLKERIIIFE